VHPAEAFVLWTSSSPKLTSDAVVLYGLTAGRKGEGFLAFGDSIVLLLAPKFGCAENPRGYNHVRGFFNEKVDAREIV
jgi:hypothetical protein